MTNQNTRRGFTLIELLVVVLIIGILVAVALPQYQRAVLKSRFAALMPIGKAMADSNEVYFLEHGNYAENLQELPVQGQQSYTDGTRVSLESEENYKYTFVSNPEKLPDNNYLVFQKHSKQFPGATMCEARGTAEQYPLAHALCASMGGVSQEGSVTSDWTAYLLSGDGTGSSFAPACPENATCDSEGQVTSCGEGYYVKNNACSTYEYVHDGETCIGEGANCDNSGFFNAVCVEGASCEGSTFSESSVCAARSNCQSSTFENSTCEGGGYCESSQFDASSHCVDESVCDGSTFGSGTGCSGAHCVGSTFIDAACDNNSNCQESTFSVNSDCISSDCTGSTFSDRSHCIEGAECASSTFRDHAYCDGSGCDTATYEGSACCKNCSVGSGKPKCGDLNNTTDTFELDGVW